MFEAITRVFKGSSDSASKAKNRLQLVIARERMGIPESQIDNLKKDLVDVISKYFELKNESLDIEIITVDGQANLKVNTTVNKPTSR